MTGNHILVGDLTHTARGISANTFPLGAAFVANYARQQHPDLSFELFKWPEEMASRVLETRPRVFAFANYSWNLELSYRLAAWAKEQVPGLVVIAGGPNFPVEPDEKAGFLAERPAIDFYVELEGEIGFSRLLDALKAADFDAARLKRERPAITNTNYLADGVLCAGPAERILDVNIIPSPYLGGLLDKFFNAPLVPMLETTRGCPFSCAYCSDGIPTKSRIARFDQTRVRQELDHIAARVCRSEELIITDLNFGMYKQDRETAEHIAALQESRHWPVIVRATAGKNQPERVIAAAAILKGSWVLGSAIQSSDPEVLANVKRANISLDAYQKFVDAAHASGDNAQSYTEIILGLPGDSRAKHYRSLADAIENGSNTLKMYQAMLLAGTDMASAPTRRAFGIQSRFRIIPGNVGLYRFGGQDVPAAEAEEIIVATKDLPFADYVACRVMNLFVETFVNHALFEEVFNTVHAMGLSRFGVLAYLERHPELIVPSMAEIIDDFVQDTTADLYDTREDALAAVHDPEIMGRYLSGELGRNELLHHRARLYLNLQDISGVLTDAVKGYLVEQGITDPLVAAYFDALKDYVVLRKCDVHTDGAPREKTFQIDFKALEQERFLRDPRTLAPLSRETRLRFYHTEEQSQHIRAMLDLYRHHSDGLGRMIYRSNMKRMYRHVSRL